LEQRLIRAFNTDGGSGIFEKFLGRSLLWQRDPKIKAMNRITFTNDEIPSWSWMAYGGSITFMDLPFDEVEWEKEEIRSPWSPHPTGSGPVWHSTRLRSNYYLEVVIREFRRDSTAQQVLIFDQDHNHSMESFKCVIIGKRKTEIDTPAQVHYVLLVTPKVGSDDTRLFERVGVGYMPAALISFDGTELKARVG
jgi:hypothetical protein